jgi:protein involved in polysaccharide export with SLBB domain
MQSQSAPSNTTITPEIKQQLKEQFKQSESQSQQSDTPKFEKESPSKEAERLKELTIIEDKSKSMLEEDALAQDFQTDDIVFLSKGKAKLKLKRFGYNLFTPPSNFAPTTNVPVGPDYHLGPGDEIRLTIWGKFEGQWLATVDRDGNITLLKIGTIGVAGLTFKEVKDVLKKELSKYYTGFEMNVSMGALRSIRVYVVGNAKKPGAYTLSSLSTLVNALFEAGGPGSTGSMRDIQVKRNGNNVTHLDLYDFLIYGDKQKDIRLMPEDVIYIPTVGPLVGIAGNVKNPAIYELKGETKISDLIALAGGLTTSAYLQRVQLERVYQNEVKIVIDTNLKEIENNKDKDIVLKDGDLLKIFPIANLVVNAVTLKGNVARPGTYQWFDGMKVSDIIKNVDKDLLPDTFFDTAYIERFVPPDFHREIISFSLGKVLFDKDPKENKVLQPYDNINIFSKWDLLEKPMVRITGAVNKPGTFEYREKMKVSDLVMLASGTKYFAYTKEAELTRVTPTQEGPKTEKIIFSPEKALEGDPEHNIKLQQDDYIFIRAIPEWDLYKTVQITGEVKFPGTYTIKKGERLSDLLKRAGGFTDKAYLTGAVFTRPSVKELQQRQIDELIDRLERELLSVSSATVATAITPEEAKIFQTETEQKRQFLNRLRQVKALGRIVVRLDEPERLINTPYDIELEEGDSIYIPSKSSTIQVNGSVYNQTAFIYSPEKDLSDYIDLAGGYTENADKGNVFILKVDGSAVKPGKGFFGIRWNKESKRWELGGSQLEPGDTKVVPEKLTRIAWMKEIKDITQILYQIAVTAGVLIVAF